jgi:cation:H+ antiporter
VLLEAATVLAVLTLTVMGSQLPPRLLWWRIDPAALLIAVAWASGLIAQRVPLSALPRALSRFAPFVVDGRQIMQGSTRARLSR